MAFTPKLGRSLTEEEAEVILARSFATQEAQKKDTSMLERVSGVADAVTNFVGARQVADTFGSEIAQARTSDPTKKALISASAPSVRETAGSALRTAGTLASLAVPMAGGLSAQVAKGAGLGYMQDVGSDLQKGASTREALKPGMGTAVGGMLPLAVAGIKKVPELIGKVGDRIQFSVIKPTSLDVKDGFSIDTVKKYNLGGSLKASAEKTDSLLDTLGKELDDKIKGSSQSVDLNGVYERTVRKVLGNKFQQFGANANIEGALEKLQGEIVGVSGKNGLVSLSEAQLVKRASGHFGAWQYGKPDPEAKAIEAVYNAFYNELKTNIEEVAPAGVREINKKLSELIPVMNAIIRRLPVAERNNALSLTDVITLTTASIEPRALTLTLANLASKSGTVGQALSKVGSAMSRGLSSPTANAIGRTIRTGLQNAGSQIGL